MTFVPSASSSTAFSPLPEPKPVPSVPPAELAVGGRLASAVGHSRRAFASLARSQGIPPKRKEWSEALKLARVEYELADADWATIAAEERPPEIVFQAQFWAADARRHVIEIQRRLGESFAAMNVEGAISAALIARESSLGRGWVRVPASSVVFLTGLVVEEAHRAFEAGDCKGPAPAISTILPAPKDGLPTVVTTTRPADQPLAGEPASTFTSVPPAATEEVRAYWEPGTVCAKEAPSTAQRIWVRDIPRVVMRNIRACEELLARVRFEDDPDAVLRCRMTIGHTLMSYGHVRLASNQLDTLWRDACGRHEVVVDAIRDLLIPASLDRDTYGSIPKAAHAQHCGMDSKTQRRLCEYAGRMHCSPMSANEGDRAFAAWVDDPTNTDSLRTAVRAYREYVELIPTGFRIPMNLAFAARKLDDRETLRFALEYVQQQLCTSKPLFEETIKRPEWCAETALQLGVLYMDSPGLAGLLDVFRYDEALDWLRVCKSGLYATSCPPLVDAEIKRATKARAAAAAMDVLP